MRRVCGRVFSSQSGERVQLTGPLVGWYWGTGAPAGCRLWRVDEGNATLVSHPVIPISMDGTSGEDAQWHQDLCAIRSAQSPLKTRECRTSEKTIRFKQIVAHRLHRVKLARTHLLERPTCNS